MIQATQDIAAFKVITADGKLADCSNLMHRLKVVGVTTAAALNGFNASVNIEGEVTNPSWTWAVGQAIYVSDLNGTSGVWSQRIGTAINATTIIINIRNSFLL